MKRKDFRVFQDKSYLLTQGGGPISNSYIKEANRLLSELALNGSDIVPKWKKEIHHIRQLLGRLLNSSEQNISFIPSVSSAMNALANTFNSTQRVLTFEDDFPTSSLAWIHNGYKVDFIPAKENGFIDLETIQSSFKKDTKIFICSHVMYRTGFRLNLEELGLLCKKRNITFIVDATQSFGVFPIDVKKFNIHALVFHGYKWLNAGFGIGAMYLSNHILEKYPKPFLGYTSVNYFGETEHNTLNFKVKDEASAYELGTSPYLNILLLGYMLNNRQKIGENRIFRRIENLIRYCFNECKKNDISIISNYPEHHLSSIININAHGITKEMLKSNGIIARANGEKITIGINYYNNKKDIKKLINYIKTEKSTINKKPL
ncbi:MAG: aminotransferase class V-fold PLP-dependent enzyme [Crocinitomicaceae bacterium]|nr:aminotransferase class V-fold PLP-dependent enzyme [Crocinitomicaceae bacterium]